MRIYITKHAKKQGKKRLGLKKDDILKEATKAFFHGHAHVDFKGSFHKYLTRQWFKYKTANNMRVFNQNVYYFCDDTLVTIIPVPQRWRHTYKKYIKKQ